MTHFNPLAPAAAVLAALAFASPAATQHSAVDTLRWLAGCWQQAGGTTVIDEQWMAPTAGTMLGVSRTVAGGRVREYEFLRVYAAGDTLVYAANPSGQTPTEFRSTLVTTSEVTFENRAHDFPQRIRYRLASPTVLVATIDGDRENRRQPVVFSYARTACVDERAASPAAAAGPAATEASVRAALQPKYDQSVEREIAAMGSTNSWFAEHSDAEFAHVMWTAGGQAVPVAGSEVLAGAGERMRAANLGAAFRNRRYTLTIEKVLLRGDTADVLVSTQHAWVFADTAGRYGGRGADVERSGTERRVDRWVRAGTDWRLRQVSIVSQEVLMGGRLVSKDGRAVSPTTPRE